MAVIWPPRPHQRPPEYPVDQEHQGPRMNEQPSTTSTAQDRLKNVVLVAAWGVTQTLLYIHTPPPVIRDYTASAGTTQRRSGFSGSVVPYPCGSTSAPPWYSPMPLRRQPCGSAAQWAGSGITPPPTKTPQMPAATTTRHWLIPARAALRTSQSGRTASAPFGPSRARSKIAAPGGVLRTEP